ncbi:MarR family winged helix-turn-helix transcriptional regulator [Falsiruegeria mediterranea]|jgi:MarR family transcriptional regulator, temperature-dependent positive regulator of motility|uniref:HTH-type transcriptional repressor NicR n=1 Tax=Falsiruegeria mediterranea M17 TaxID=1200281 RepID=A0A2R8CCP1_9RHOB|nr:MarR family transcriptional regulator [Falsiruegeria mediterranea]SPJ30175.1 HTH-type transcriptional repressor NicR [Falsiruegeria mediterranea M17]
MTIYAMPGHLIRRLNQISVALFMDRMAQADIKLTPVQFATLTTIRLNPGLDQASLAGLIAYDRATLGKVIDRLAARGLVCRTISVHDRRARCLQLTNAGNELLDAARPLVEAVQPEMLSGLSPTEQEQLIALLKKTTDAGNALSRAPLAAATQDQLKSDQYSRG